MMRRDAHSIKTKRNQKLDIETRPRQNARKFLFTAKKMRKLIWAGRPSRTYFVPTSPEETVNKTDATIRINKTNETH